MVNGSKVRIEFQTRQDEPSLNPTKWTGSRRDGPGERLWKDLGKGAAPWQVGRNRRTFHTDAPLNCSSAGRMAL